MAATWANHLADGFDHQLASDVGKGHTSGTVSTQVSTANTRFNYGNACSAPTFLDALGNYETWRIAGAFKKDIISGAVGTLCVFKDNTTVQVDIRLQSDGAIQARVGGTQVAISAPGAVSMQTWFWLSVQVRIANSGGVIHVYLNGQLLLTFTGDTQSTANAYASQAGPEDSLGTNHVDDYVVSAGTGTPVAGDALPDSRVLTSFVDVQGDLSDFTPNSGSNHVDRVRDAPSTFGDGDTTYLQSNSAADQESFLTDDLPVDVATIHMVQVTAMTRKDDAAARTCKLFTRRGGTTTLQASAQSVLDAYRFLHFVQVVDPNTAAAWTRTNVDATQIGYELTT